VADLRRYFQPDLMPGAAPTYSGSRFEALAGGGDRQTTADRITSDDLVAVSLLAVDVPGDVSLQLLEGVLGDEVARWLALIPTNVAIHDEAAAEALGRHSPAWMAWELLDEPHDMGPTKVSKLLARKRPGLVPVWDDVVRCVLGRPDHPWAYVRELFAGGQLHERLVIAAREAGVPAHVSALRMLDVILWMRHVRQHGRSRCPGPDAVRV
jgi:hypothetical protein